MKPEQNKMRYTSLEKIWDLSSMRMRQVDKKEQKGAKFKNTFPFLKTNYFEVIDITKKYHENFKYSLMAANKASENCNFPV